MCSSPRTRQAYSPPASSMSASTGSSPKAARCMRIASSATSNTPMPPTWLAVPRKYLSTSSLFEADGLEQLRAAVGHVGGDAHLRHDLRQALADRLDVVVDRLVGDRSPGRSCAARPAFRARGTDARLPRRSRPARAKWCTSRAEPVSTTRPAVVRRPSRTRCWWTADSASSAGMATCSRLERAVGDDQDVVAALDRIDRLGAQRRELGLDAFVAPGERVGDVELVALELADV